MSESFLNQSFDKWNVQERETVVQGINLADFGNENKFEFEIEPGVRAESTEVLVSSEHLQQPGDQRRPVDFIVYSEDDAGSMPAGEVSWSYAQMPDGTVELQDLATVARVDGKEQRQGIHRVFRNDGSVSSEEVKIDSKLFTLRTYAPKEDYDGAMVYDDYYDLEGNVERRVVYYQKEVNGPWESYRSVFNDGDERTEKAEGSLSGPPALKGIPQLNKYVDTPSLRYKDPTRIAYQELH